MDVPLGIADAFSVRGQVVLITGAAGWIGSAIVRVFAGNGARVVATDRTQESLAALETQLPETTRPEQRIPADLLDLGQLKELVGQTIARCGKIDALIHCGGLPSSSRLLDGPDSDFDRLFHTNVRSGWALARAALEHLAQTQGCIVNIASVNGHRAMFPGHLYAATKAALLSMTREMAAEFGPRLVRVNSVSPGAIVRPEMYLRCLRGKLTPAYLAAYEQRILEGLPETLTAHQPLARAGTPADVAWACVYLCAPAARFVSSADIVVDGAYLQEFRGPNPQGQAFWQSNREWLRRLPAEAWADEPPEWVTK